MGDDDVCRLTQGKDGMPPGRRLPSCVQLQSNWTREPNVWWRRPGGPQAALVTSVVVAADMGNFDRACRARVSLTAPPGDSDDAPIGVREPVAACHDMRRHIQPRHHGLSAAHGVDDLECLPIPQTHLLPTHHESAYMARDVHDVDDFITVDEREGAVAEDGAEGAILGTRRMNNACSYDCPRLQATGWTHPIESSVCRPYGHGLLVRRENTDGGVTSHEHDWDPHSAGGGGRWRPVVLQSSVGLTDGPKPRRCLRVIRRVWRVKSGGVGAVPPVPP